MPQRILNVHPLPQNFPEHDPSGSTVVVIDLLRASTTICHALASGATEVVPFLEVADALAAADAADDRGRIVLGGERGGTRIEGFDLGNSPAEYTPEAVGGRQVFITTTNGTRALEHARLARRVLVGSIVNLSAVVRSLKDESRVDIFCAGTDGRETYEDWLAAGAIVYSTCQSPFASWSINDEAEVARLNWEELLATARASGRSASEQLAIELRISPGGMNLLAINLEADLVDCAQIDKLNVVPELDVRSWRIVLP